METGRTSSRYEFTDPSGSAIKLRFNNSAATANGFRSSGASAMLARYVKRRGGTIVGTPSSAAGGSDTIGGCDADIGTSVMRCAFDTTLPFSDNNFRWIGTANGVELDTSWNQPASFAFWLPNNLMEMVIAVVLLRSTFVNPPQVEVNLAAFEPAIPYQFGDTAGMLRHTAVTFQGNFSVPNDFRAVLGELR